ncbi:uncharacterized protein LOC127868002 isoform X2 [Dreissena polymorpha]|uniref:RNA-dependent RNA polymerase n=1 Tax=Dreissena polymorpha TaxID=45954 RepID=A0A9D4M4V7_DREPO|nr:uncharacterized protein LOC127868002 isoform X2 [Dreissena polymorpha]KAH3869364.1 hypothetical protein DPMN_032527 [Dreissena polymorpha]
MAQNVHVENDFSFVKEFDRTDRRIQIPILKLYEHEYKQEWAKFTKVNRFFSRFGYKQLLCLHFDNNFPSKRAEELCLKGVKVNGKAYEFLGCSTAGIKQRKCFMWQGTRDEVVSILKECGEFGELKTVSQYLGSISLLFSDVQLTPIIVKEKQIIRVSDIERDGYNFTDGCGAIGTTLAKELAAHIKDKALDSGYVPSVFQVRFQGYKGVLAIDPAIDPSSILLRPSMKKFNTDSYPELCACGYSKTNTFGDLNEQFIQLLSVLGVHSVEKRNKRVIESRNIYGVCDQSDTLDYGQCFLRITINGKPVTLSGRVVVCKNPCYLLGDVRVLTAISDSSVSKLNHLVDCIVFPTKGKRPHAHEIAGSDLDGDQFFVAWDPDLIPKTVRAPYYYPSVECRTEGDVTHAKVCSYFAKQNHEQKKMVKIDRLFKMWAARKGVESVECEKLGQLFARVVDASKTEDEVEIPEELILEEPV